MKEPSAKDYVLAAMILVIVALIWFSNRVENQLNAAKEDVAAAKATIADLERKSAPPKGKRSINLHVDDNDRTEWIDAWRRCQSYTLVIDNRPDRYPSVRFSECSL